MATLTETAYVARKSINIGFIILVLVVIARVLILAGIGLKDKLFPPAPAPATVAFGKLPYPNAQNSVATPSGVITYTIETIDGNLPALPSLMKVYFMPKPGPSFGSFDRMTALAAKMSFTTVPSKTSGTTWRFIDGGNPLRILDVDEISLNFRLTYNFTSDLALFNDQNLSSQNDVISAATSFFDGLGTLTSDLRAGTQTVTLFHLDAGALVPTTVRSAADAAGVTLNRADIVNSPDPKAAKIPVVYPDANQGLISLLLSSSNNVQKKVLEARYLYSVVDKENWATYPLIKSADALANLKAGKAIFAGLPNPSPTAVTIRQVYLAYLDPYPSQSYLQPVLVFSDQRGFVAYVPVVSGDWLQ